jgi:ribosomal protein S18 acetylase RimI-like enzyme
MKKRIAVCRDKHIVGYLESKIPDDLVSDRNIEIAYIYVEPKYRRQGVATELINMFFSQHPEVTWITLWTSRECEIDGSFDLYKKLGFVEGTYLPDYYEPGVGTRHFALRRRED